MTDRELMQQALGALEGIQWPGSPSFVKAAITALRERLAQLEQKPVPWESFFKRYCPWLEQPEQEPTAERAWFTIAELNAWADKKLSENPHWVMPKDKPERDEPPPQRKPLTDEEKAVLRECRERAMKWTVQGRIPECGAFGEIAQDLDWLCDQLAAHGIKGEA